MEPAMKTNNTTISTNTCLPCDIPPFCRNNFFTGKLLTERDFTAEQKYIADKLRLHHVALHGWGVVCGLKVAPHPHCPALRIVIEPGLAVDGCGREVRVPNPYELSLPPSPPLVMEDPCPPDPTSKASQEENTTTAEGEDDTKSPSVNLYVGLRYIEHEAELMPTPFNESPCGCAGKQPNRICEGYEIQAFTDEPKSFELVRREKEECDSYDSDAIYKSVLNGCPAPSDFEWIPLAVISDFVPGQELKKQSIHNWVYRRLLPSTTTLDRLIRCILERIPTRILTQIVGLNWQHRGEYHCHEFMRLFIGEHSPGFEVAFDSEVRAEGISQRTFQAIAVRYPEKLDGAGQSEIVPATVRLNSERTRVHLRIDPQYARNRLDRTRFDLYLLMRCNLIVDDRGYPVDGELLGKLDQDGAYVAAPPTGDSIPGGLFESWIRVVHHEDIRER
jgi:hypothetical protein